MGTGCQSLIETEHTKDDHQYKIAVGKGGGFTGVYEEFILREDGKVFKRDFNYDREVFTKDLGEVDHQYFWGKKDELGLEGFEFNHPGNITTYIELRQGTISLNKISWGANSYYPPDEFIKFHKELTKKLKED